MGARSGLREDILLDSLVSDGRKEGMLKVVDWLLGVGGWLCAMVSRFFSVRSEGRCVVSHIAVRRRVLLCAVHDLFHGS